METGVKQLQKGLAYEAALYIWQRRKWLGIPIFLVVFTAVISVVAFLPNVYKASATVLVERQKVPEKFVQSTVTSDIDYRLQSITQQILSRSRLESLINRFNLYSKMRQEQPLEKVVALVRENIGLELQSEKKRRGGTTVAFTLSYSGPDPQILAEVTNTLASFYIEENLKAREEQASGTAKFLQAQLEDIKRKLETQEKLISQFKEQHIGQLPEQLQANLSALEQLNTQLRLNSDKHAWAIEQRRSLSQQLAGEGENSGKGPPTT